MAEFPVPVRFELVEDVARDGDAKPAPRHRCRAAFQTCDARRAQHLTKHPN